MVDKNYLSESPILDFNSEAIQDLIAQRGWRELSEFDCIGAVYDFVRNEISFGYNASDDLLASKVLQDGYGQCNTKGNLLMALLRALGIPCRFHGFTIENELQKGAIPIFLFPLAPRYILHSWVEIYYEGAWLNLEGFILDQRYLSVIQVRYANVCEQFKGYGVATTCLRQPEVRWQGRSTYIQKEGIHDDFGVYETPDEFYRQHGTNLHGLKRRLYQYVFRHIMNWNVRNIRSGVAA